jgi:hypothetical protein
MPHIHIAPLSTWHYVGMWWKMLVPHQNTQTNTTRTQKANAHCAYLVVPQKTPHPHKETKTAVDQ